MEKRLGISQAVSLSILIKQVEQNTESNSWIHLHERMIFDYCERFFVEWLIFMGYNNTYNLTQSAKQTAIQSAATAAAWYAIMVQ